MNVNVGFLFHLVYFNNVFVLESEESWKESVNDEMPSTSKQEETNNGMEHRPQASNVAAEGEAMLYSLWLRCHHPVSYTHLTLPTTSRV